MKIRGVLERKETRVRKVSAHPFLSIILPIYKVEDYLGECLDSLYQQNVSESEYEVICVNDGSPDSCDTILKEYSNKHNNMIIVNQENQGVSAARNAGINVAIGDYIWFVDPDDLIVPNYLLQLKNYVMDSQVDLLIFRIYQFNHIFSQGERIQARQHLLPCNNPNDGIFTRLIKRKVVENNRVYFNRNLVVGEDIVYIVQIDEAVNSVRIIEDVIYCYRQHSSSVTHTSNEELRIKKLSSHILGAELCLDIYNSKMIKKQSTADAAMYFIWASLLDIASHRDGISAKYLQIMKEKKLFPIKRLPESAHKKMYATSRRDFIGKVYNYLTTHSNSRGGLQLLRLWYIAYNQIYK